MECLAALAWPPRLPASATLIDFLGFFLLIVRTILSVKYIVNNEWESDRVRTIAAHTSLLEGGLGDRVDPEAKTHILAVRNLSGFTWAIGQAVAQARNRPGAMADAIADAANLVVTAIARERACRARGSSEVGDSRL